MAWIEVCGVQRSLAFELLTLQDGITKGLFTRSGGHKTKETYPTRPGSPTPCKQALIKV